MSAGARALISLLVIAISAMVTALTVELEPPPPPPPSQVESIFPFAADAVRGIDVRSWEGSIRAVRREGHWRVEQLVLRNSATAPADTTAPTEAQIDEAVGTLVRDVASLPEVYRFPLEGAPGQFGLDDPRVVVVLTLASGETVRLEIGGRTTTGAGLYARIVGSDEILQIGGLILSDIGAAFFRLRGLAA